MAQLAKQTAAEAARRAIRDATQELQRIYDLYGRDAGLPEAEVDRFTKVLKGEASRAEARQAVRDALELHHLQSLSFAASPAPASRTQQPLLLPLSLVRTWPPFASGVAGNRKSASWLGWLSALDGNIQSGIRCH